MATVPCPTCNRPVKWTEASPWRPFCSERCKLVDLGAWAAEKHKVPGEPALGEDDADFDADADGGARPRE
jgi:endogenous inhibitor of DNA gyrase (YacG/DUF329 family)